MWLRLREMSRESVYETIGLRDKPQRSLICKSWMDCSNRRRELLSQRIFGEMAKWH